jgi:hypothetical protein
MSKLPISWNDITVDVPFLKTDGDLSTFYTRDDNGSIEITVATTVLKQKAPSGAFLQRHNITFTNVNFATETDPLRERRVSASFTVAQDDLIAEIQHCVSVVGRLLDQDSFVTKIIGKQSGAVA